MKANAFLIAICLGSHLAFGDAAKAPAKPAHPKPKIIDLDFTGEDEAESKSGMLVAPAKHQWIFWALGATAAAGGLGWYWHEQSDKAPAIIRNEQVFTDDRP